MSGQAASLPGAPGRARRSVRTRLETPRERNLALALLAMTQFVVVIDASIVNVALPTIGSTCTSPAMTCRGS